MTLWQPQKHNGPNVFRFIRIHELPPAQMFWNCKNLTTEEHRTQRKLFRILPLYLVFDYRFHSLDLLWFFYFLMKSELHSCFASESLIRPVYKAFPIIIPAIGK